MHKQRGLSLVELLISLTLGVLLMGGVMQMFIASKQTFSTQQGLSRVQESGRLAVEIISRDIRMAGYMGCASQQFADNDNGGICKVNNTPGCITNGLRPTPDGSMMDFSGPAIRGFNSEGPFAEAVKAGTDVLVIRSAGDSSFGLTQMTGGASSVVDVPSVDGCIGDVCEDDIVIISDCSQGRQIQVTNINQGAGGGGGQGRATFVHNSGGGNSPGNWAGPGNQWGQTFQPGAEVFKVSNIAYFIADNAQNRPVLWQKINNDPAVQLLEGVEDMELTYSTDGGATYVNHTGVGGAWNSVTSVRINLLVRSQDTDVLPVEQEITFRGAAVDTSDRRMRQVFTNTIGVRSRLP